MFLDWLVSSESKLFPRYLTECLNMVKNEFHFFVMTIHGIKYFPDGINSTADIATANCTPTAAATFNSINIETDVQLMERNNTSHRIVDYSSSSSEDEDSLKTTNVDKFMSCLIRLNLKLDRMRTQDLLCVELHGLIKTLDDIECMYEANS